MKRLFYFFLLTIFCTGCSDKPTEPYQVSKEVKTFGVVHLDIKLNARLNKGQLVAIASKIKKDSSKYDNLQLDFLLPGSDYKDLGGVAPYATINYHEAKKVTPADTVMDLHDNRLQFVFTGFSSEEAKQLLAINPKGMETKTVLGKFIDDQTKTISIIYRDGKEGDQVSILELDPTGKVISATQPMEVTANGIHKLIITQQGDYCTLDNGTLTLYGADNPDKPFRTLKAGI